MQQRAFSSLSRLFASCSATLRRESSSRDNFTRLETSCNNILTNANSSSPIDIQSSEEIFTMSLMSWAAVAEVTLVCRPDVMRVTLSSAAFRWYSEIITSCILMRRSDIAAAASASFFSRSDSAINPSRALCKLFRFEEYLLPYSLSSDAMIRQAILQFINSNLQLLHLILSNKIMTNN